MKFNKKCKGLTDGFRYLGLDILDVGFDRFENPDESTQLIYTNGFQNLGLDTIERDTYDIFKCFEKVF